MANDQKTVYYCECAECEVYVDDYENGLTKYVQTYEIPLNYEADELDELVKRIYSFFYVKPSDVTIHAEDSIVSFDRLENGDGDEPTKREIERWEKGELVLYNNSICVSVSKKIKLGDVPKSEFEEVAARLGCEVFL